MDRKWKRVDRRRTEEGRKKGGEVGEEERKDGDLRGRNTRKRE